MKYMLYIDYRSSHTVKYRPLTAKTIEEAIMEADTIHDIETMYLIQIMKKNGKVEKVESDVKAQAYTAIMEKRSSKWTLVEHEHNVKHYVAKYGEWFN